MIGHPKVGVGGGTWAEEADPKLDLRITAAVINRAQKSNIIQVKVCK